MLPCDRTSEGYIFHFSLFFEIFNKICLRGPLKKAANEIDHIFARAWVLESVQVFMSEA